jgi:fructose/tagatose bisphosphate aldolase
MVKTGNPKLDINRVREVRSVGGVPLVLHGGSGVSDEDFIASIQAGISMIHVSTELRRAYRQTLDQTLSNNDTLAPYRYLAPSKLALKAVAKDKLKLFSMVHLLN